jgi:hypothetical protein
MILVLTSAAVVLVDRIHSFREVDSHSWGAGLGAFLVAVVHQLVRVRGCRVAFH